MKQTMAGGGGGGSQVLSFLWSFAHTDGAPEMTGRNL